MRDEKWIFHKTKLIVLYANEFDRFLKSEIIPLATADFDLLQHVAHDGSSIATYTEKFFPSVYFSESILKTPNRATLNQRY